MKRHANTIRLPRSVLPTAYSRCRCLKHDVGMNEENILFAGVGRTSGGSRCLAVEWQCIVCRKPHRALLYDHPFNRVDWWTELAGWHDNAPPTINVRRRDLPKIGPMVLDMAGLESVWIRGAYKGEIGPVMLIYESVDGESMYGVMRLERESRISLFYDTDPNCLPGHMMARFLALADGESFPLDGRTWTKMSVKEIEEIVRDRVFSVAT